MLIYAIQRFIWHNRQDFANFAEEIKAEVSLLPSHIKGRGAPVWDTLTVIANQLEVVDPNFVGKNLKVQYGYRILGKQYKAGSSDSAWLPKKDGSLRTKGQYYSGQLLPWLKSQSKLSYIDLRQLDAQTGMLQYDGTYTAHKVYTMFALMTTFLVGERVMGMLFDSQEPFVVEERAVIPSMITNTTRLKLTTAAIQTNPSFARKMGSSGDPYTWYDTTKAWVNAYNQLKTDHPNLTIDYNNIVNNYNKLFTTMTGVK